MQRSWARIRADGAVITYYQQKRHIFGKMKIEIFDATGKLVDTVPANSRRGLTRVEWANAIEGSARSARGFGCV